MKIKIVVHEAEEGGYWAEVPAIPGCATQGETMEELLGDGNARFVLDVGEVPMIDSSGIGVIVRSLTSAKQRGGSLKLVNPSKLAMQTLKIVGLLGLFEVYNDEAEAVGSFS